MRMNKIKLVNVLMIGLFIGAGVVQGMIENNNLIKHQEIKNTFLKSQVSNGINYGWIKILYPNGGEIIENKVTINWGYGGLSSYNSILFNIYLTPYEHESYVIKKNCAYTNYIWNSTAVKNGQYYIHVEMYGDGTFLGDDYSDFLFTIDNQVSPNKPSKPYGPSYGKVNKLYAFSTNTTDQNNDKVKYGWDWNGDKQVDVWSGLYNSGFTDTRSYGWESPGTYNISVKAKDVHGFESDWSEPLRFSIPKIHNYNANIQSIFEMIKQLPLFEQTLKPLLGFSYIESSINNDLIKIINKGSITNHHTINTYTMFGDTLDQSCAETQGAGCNLYYPNNAFIYAQSFIPTLSIQTRMQVYMSKIGNPTGTIQVSIRDSLNGQDLTSVNVSIDSVSSDYTWVSCNIPDITVTKGKTYYILARAISGWSDTKNHCQWLYGLSGWYPFGAGYVNDGTTWDILTQMGVYYVDFCFKTYGDDRPDRPIIDGPSEVKIGSLAYYNITVHEPESEDIYLYIDWGDNTTSEWLGPYKTDKKQSIGHIWEDKGIYEIKMKAKDTDGLESDWATLEISLPKIHTYNPIMQLILKMLESFPFLHSLIFLDAPSCPLTITNGQIFYPNLRKNIFIT